MNLGWDIAESEKLGELNDLQLDYFQKGIELNFGCTLDKDPRGFWLRVVPEGGAVLMESHRTVDHVWKSAEAIDKAREECL